MADIHVLNIKLIQKRAREKALQEQMVSDDTENTSSVAGNLRRAESEVAAELLKRPDKPLRAKKGKRE